MEQQYLEQKSRTQEFFEERLPAVLEDGSSYPLLLVALGEKPAALSMNVNHEQIEVLEEFCEEFNLHLRIYEGRMSKPDTAVGQNPSFNQKGAFIAKNPERFKILENSEGRFYGASDEAVGKFLDFPEKAIRFFNSTEQPGLESRKEIQRMKQKEEINSDLKYLNLITHIPAPEKESVEKAVETGKKREKLLEQFDKEMDTEIGRKYLNRRFGNNLY